MNALRKFVGWMLAVTLMAFVSPSFAQGGSVAKIYSMAVSPLGSTVVDVTLTNETPSGNSTINSFRIEPPANTTVTIVGAFRNGTAVPATVAPCGSNICVNGFDGLKASQRNPYFLTIRLNVSYTGGLTCGSSWTWKAKVFTGNSFGQEEFNQIDATTKALLPGNPGVSQTNVCGYKVEITPTSLARGSTKDLNAKVTNGSSTTITKVNINPPTNGGITVSTTEFTQNIVNGTPANITLAAAKVACEAAGGQWSTSVQPAGFTKSAPDTETGVYGDCNLAFGPLPSSIVPGQPFTITVRMKDGDGNTIPGFGGDVTLTPTGDGCTLASGGAGTQTISGGVVTISGVKLGVTDAKSCKLKAEATYETKPYTVESGPIQLYKGVLACNEGYDDLEDVPYPPESGPTGYFSASTGSTVNDPGFAAGYRAKDDKSGCTGELVNYTFTNNLKGNGSTTDAHGNTIPKNGVSFVWDESALPDGVFVYTVTFKEDWAGSNGLPKNGEQWCKQLRDGSGNPLPTNCVPSTTSTPNPNLFPLKACLTTEDGVPLKALSIPAEGTEEGAACILRRSWVVVPVSNCGWDGTGDPPTCIRVTTTILDAKDPPIIWGGLN